MAGLPIESNVKQKQITKTETIMKMWNKNLQIMEQTKPLITDQNNFNAHTILNPLSHITMNAKLRYISSQFTNLPPNKRMGACGPPNVIGLPLPSF